MKDEDDNEYSTYLDDCGQPPRSLLPILLLLWLFLAVTSCRAATLNANAVRLLPVLAEEIEQHWPSVRPRSALAAQVDKETCITQTHRFCWNPHAELKTSREYGFGLGQITVTERFNVFNEVKQLDRSLHAWGWEQRYDARLQLRALVLKDRQHHRQCTAVFDEPLACAFAAYNGGMGGVLADRRLCAATEGCNPRVWFGHVEKTSTKAKTAVAGYGESFFAINRRYVREVLFDRRFKYIPHLDGA